MTTNGYSEFRVNLRRSMSVALGLVSVFLSACQPTGSTPSDNSNDNGSAEGPGGVTVDIVSYRQNSVISVLSPSASVIYSVVNEPTGTTITGRIVQVADNSPGASEIDEPIDLPGLLPSGAQRSYSLCLPPDDDSAGTCSLNNIPVGFYRAGVVVNVPGFDPFVRYSNGVIHIQGPPDPEFIQPVGNENREVTVTIGSTVLVTFDVSDPEGDVQWRLFLLNLSDGDELEGSVDEYGVQLLTGSGNFGTYSLATSALTAGDYQLGISATDTGSSISTSIDNGQSSRIVTLPTAAGGTGAPIIHVTAIQEPQPPTIAITSPGASDVQLFRDEAFTIQLTATANEPGANAVIELFADTDNNASNGFISIASDLPVTVTSYPWPADLEEGDYFIGARIDDRTGNTPVVSYSTGLITVVREVFLVVTAPNTNLPIPPSSATGTPNTIQVAWDTNLPPSAGTVDVYARTVSAAGSAFGAEISVLAATTPATETANFSSQSSGLFEITVRLTLSDGTVEALQQAPKHVRVSSLPAIVWVGEFADADADADGGIFEGVNFEDNAGTSFASVGDINGDGFDDFVVNARYGKPFFTNPTGVGPGEAYLVYGGAQKYRGTRSLNALGTASFRGVTFTGIRIPQASNDTDGLTSVTSIPDVDGDNRPELMFSFPRAESRGHNVDFRQDGVFDPNDLCTLERHDQFLNGGVVIVSSKNSILRNPTTGDPVINLDLVGQDFQITTVVREPAPETELGLTFDILDIRALEEEEDIFVCVGNCVEPSSDELLDAVLDLDTGFNPTLADDYFTAFVENGCAEGLWGIFCGEFLCGDSGYYLTSPASPLLSIGAGFTGFYPTTFPDPDSEDETDRLPNQPLEPLGARIIGIGEDDAFGTSVSLIRPTTTGAGQVIISAPNRTARGILFGYNDDDPPTGGEVDGLESSPGQPGERINSGVAYLFDVRNLWEADSQGRIPPKPHQYMIGQPSHYDEHVDRIANIDAIRIAGQSQEKINDIAGIDDFNGDGRNDFAIGSPTSNSNAGRVYVAFRRQGSIEGDYVLEKLSESPTDPDRLDGVMIIANTVSNLGASLASGIDFNGDGQSDLVIGAPGASSGAGEVVVVFGDGDLVSPADGITVDTLLNTRNAAGQPRAARITGLTADTNGAFGFNVANVGDIDGDGTNDLAISAPNASPRFDATPTDATDSLSDLGVDIDFNGVKDDVSGPLGLADGNVDTFDNLVNAGLVYVIFGSNRLDQIPATNLTINISQLGTSRLKGFIVVGRRAGDRLGGGDAGSTSLGGISAKQDRGRSFGLAGAGDVDGDGRDDLLIGSVLADPRIDAASGVGVKNGGESYLIYGSTLP